MIDDPDREKIRQAVATALRDAIVKTSERGRALAIQQAQKDVDKIMKLVDAYVDTVGEDL